MASLRLYKKEKLCSVVAIEKLFGRAGAELSQLAYPLRLVARSNPRRSSDSPVAFLISVPKKRLRHAVDRVQMRRRIREAYRLNRHPALDEMNGSDCRVDVAFIYVADRLMEYAAVERAMRRLLTAIARHYVPQTDQPEDESIVQSHP